MNDLALARERLGSHSLCVCKNGESFTRDGRGIVPVLRLIDEGTDVSGGCAADIIVGKAAAMLFVKLGISGVYGKVMSRAARDFLSRQGIPCQYGTLADKIINRRGDGICPMEQAVADVDDVEQGYAALVRRVQAMRKEQGTP